MPRHRRPLAFPQCDDHDERLGCEPPCDEPEYLSRRPVQPLRVIDEADQWLGFGDLGEETEDRKPDQKAIGRRARQLSERRCKCVSLRTWQTLEMIEKWRAELVQPGERQFHLGLDAGRAHDPTSGRLPEDVVEQRGLADAGLASHDNGRASAAASVCQQPI